MRDASICGLGQTASSAIESRHPDCYRYASPRPMTPIDPILFRPPPRSPSTPEAPPARPRRAIALTIDGGAVSVPDGSTILEACRAQGIDTPTLCYLENLTPVNVCRVCVVEVAGSRVLVPACSRKVEPGMDVQTDSRAGPPFAQARPRAPRLLGRPLDRRPAEPDGSIAA